LGRRLLSFTEFRLYSVLCGAGCSAAAVCRPIRQEFELQMNILASLSDIKKTVVSCGEKNNG